MLLKLSPLLLRTLEQTESPEGSLIPNPGFWDPDNLPRHFRQQRPRKLRATWLGITELGNKQGLAGYVMKIRNFEQPVSIQDKVCPCQYATFFPTPKRLPALSVFSSHHQDIDSFSSILFAFTLTPQINSRADKTSSATGADNLRTKHPKTLHQKPEFQGVWPILYYPRHVSWVDFGAMEKAVIACGSPLYLPIEVLDLDKFRNNQCKS